jgi:2-C-methyl-D-erythritol 4-phosphate cytidylyltransferase
VELIKKAFEQEYNEAFTDEATILEHMGIAINLIEGSKSNIKITTPEDMVIAEAFMQLQNNSTIK